MVPAAKMQTERPDPVTFHKVDWRPVKPVVQTVSERKLSADRTPAELPTDNWKLTTDDCLICSLF
jgi:hypothetical protein